MPILQRSPQPTQCRIFFKFCIGVIKRQEIFQTGTYNTVSQDKIRVIIHCLFYDSSTNLRTRLSISSLIEIGIMCLPRVSRSLTSPWTVTLSMPFSLIISIFGIIITLAVTLEIFLPSGVYELLAQILLQP